MPTDDPLTPLEALCLAALDHVPPAERSLLVTKIGAAEAHALARIEQLLLASSTDTEPQRLPTDTSPSSPEVLGGRYRLKDRIGEGGMGTVWRAEQLEPVRRVVAIKRMKQGVDSRAFLARFETERQALALMDHPNIARVFDGGTDAAGLPYFVMEHVDGVPLTQAIEANTLGVVERLRLFQTICHAVQHAHQKGILHRDLKPSNVLVTQLDDQLVPKVIDFGIAKTMAGKLTDLTLSETGAFVGTPVYMSPEQANPLVQDVDTRSDVYALGVILYEMLTGTTPIDLGSVDTLDFVALIQRVREESPMRPSVRVRQRPDTAAPCCGWPHAVVAKYLHGELDWIILKALEKERARRYGSPAEMAAEIEAFLSHRPVTARPPSRGYLLRKFVRRNVVAVVATTLVGLALIAGIIGTTWGLLRAKASAAVATNRLDEARRKTRILGTIFAEVDLDREEKEGIPLKVIIGEQLDQAAAEINSLEATADQPEEHARLLHLLGKALLKLERTRSGHATLTKAVALFETSLGPDHEETLTARSELAHADSLSGKHALATTQLEAIVVTAKRLLGEDHPKTLEWEDQLAKSLRDQGDLPRAYEILKALANRADQHPERLFSIHLTLGSIEMDRREYTVALERFEACVPSGQARLGWRSEAVLRGYAEWVTACLLLKQYDRSFTILNEAIPNAIKAYGLDHYLTLSLKNLLGETYRRQLEFAKSIAVYEELVDLQHRRYGKRHGNSLAYSSNLANALVESGKADTAIPLMHEILDRSAEVRGKEHPEHLSAEYNLAFVLFKYKKDARCLVLMEEVIRGLGKLHGADHATTLQKRFVYAQMALSFQRGDLFASLWPPLLAAYRTAYANQPAQMIDRLTKMSAHAKANGRAELAAEMLAERKQWEARRIPVPGRN